MMENVFMQDVLLENNPYSPRTDFSSLPNGDKQVRVVYPSALMDAIGEISAREREKKFGTLIIKDEQLLVVLYEMFNTRTNEYFGNREVDGYYNAINSKLKELWSYGAINDECLHNFTESGECRMTFDVLSLFFIELFRPSDDCSRKDSVFCFRSDTMWAYENICEWLTPEYKDFFDKWVNLYSLSAVKKTTALLLSAFINLPNKNAEKCLCKTYVMSDGSGLYKIGRSTNPRKREDSLLCGNPNIRLLIVIDCDMENELHKKFAQKRVSGEWFKLTDDDLEYIRSLDGVIFG